MSGRNERFVHFENVCKYYNNKTIITDAPKDISAKTDNTDNKHDQKAENHKNKILPPKNK